VYLENLSAIQFEIQYDENILELDIDNCGEDSTANCEVSDSNLAYLINTSNPGFIIGIIYSGMFFNIENDLVNIKFNIIGSVGESSDIIFNVFEINDIDVREYTENGLVTIGNFGCMDFNACNYSSEATFNNDSCQYTYDCFDVCGGTAIEDCDGACGGSVQYDCTYDSNDELTWEDACGGSALVDECGECDGNGILNSDCDCDGTQPFTYCYDLDGDGLGNPNLDIPGYPFQYCDLIEGSESLVLDCSDTNDSCPLDQDVDECGVCEGDGPGSMNCCPNTGLSILGEASDDCGICGGDMFGNDNGFYPDGYCDCNETSPLNYCIDINQDGASDFESLSSCDGPPSDIFVICETLSIRDEVIDDYSLLSVYPNPFNPSITINYGIDNTGFVSIKVLDLNGRYIRTLCSSIKTQGLHSINWEPNKKISSGIYLLEMKYNNQNFIEKINYIK